MTNIGKGQAFIKWDKQLKTQLIGLTEKEILSDAKSSYQPPFGCASAAPGTPGGLIGISGGLIGTPGDDLKSYAF